MKFEQHEIHSGVWVKLKAHLEEQLNMSRALLESDLPKKRTTQVRERTKVLKELLALGEPSPATVADDE